MTLPITDTLTFERHIKASPDRVWQVWTDFEERKKWEPTPAGMKTEHDGHQFVVGGLETSRMYHGETLLAEFETRILDIEPKARVVSHVKVIAGGTTLSCSQHTFSMQETEGGTLVIFNEQVAWFNGQSMRDQHESGWASLLDKIQSVAEE